MNNNHYSMEKKCSEFKVLPGYFDRERKMYIPDKYICARSGEECECKGCTTECVFKRQLENSYVTTIYYAHHQWKYDTKVETYELGLIERYFPHAMVHNPKDSVDSYGRSEEEIMADCLSLVDKSDILIFSSMDGAIGIGCFEEVMAAQRAGKLVFYIYQNKLHTDFHITSNFDEPKNDRVHAFVTIGKEN